jgi:hypothetical protein
VDGEFKPNEKGKTIIKESHFYINDDKEHDSLFVHHCLIMHWRWLIDQGVKPKHHIV